jgi:signal peptidase I
VKRIRLRSASLTGVLVTLAAAAWLYLAPPLLGGSTSYVVTHGISMEPRFHTGDLALVRPAAHYAVGDVVAYHSALLHIVVLHRIIAIHGGHYFFKGDNNNFVDPVQPTRANLLGKLWVHIHDGGPVLAWLHSPFVVVGLIGGAGLLVLSGFVRKRRRRERRGKSGAGPVRHGAWPMNLGQRSGARSVDLSGLPVGCAAVAAVFLCLGLFALLRPADKASTHNVPYTQQVSFGYHASAPAGPVYPNGVVTTGDPIFLQLVHKLRIDMSYRLAAPAAHDVTGTEKVTLKVTGPSGWSRSLALTAPVRFRGDHLRTSVTLNIPQVQALLARVQSLTGVPAASGYTLAVTPDVRVRGVLAGQALAATLTRSMTFEIEPLQLQPGGASAAPTGTPGAPASSSAGSSGAPAPQKGQVSTASTSPNTLGVAGHSLSVSAVRWLGLLGFLVAGAAAFLLAGFRRSRPFGEAAQIQSKYGHMIIPIVAGEDLGWPPVDVTTIKALVRLAECGQRMILHAHDDDADTYMVNEEGTVYRYQARSNVVWGEWSEVAAVQESVAAAAPETMAAMTGPASTPAPA